jgi:hypothetical protein
MGDIRRPFDDQGMMADLDNQPDQANPSEPEQANPSEPEPANPSEQKGDT